jgi:hypothetical protein
MRKGLAVSAKKPKVLAKKPEVPGYGVFAGNSQAKKPEVF